MKKQINIQGKQYFDEYILIAPGSDYGKAMWSDIALLDNGIILDNVLKPTNKLISVLHHIHFSFVINRIVQLPFQHIWKKMYSFSNVSFNCKKQYCVIYTDISAARTDHRYLKELHSRENVTLVMVMVNTMARRASLLKNRFQYFSIIFSFDEQDSEKYGFIYHPTNYSMVAMENDVKLNSDAFYVGVSKGRANSLAEIYTKLVQGEAKIDFNIVGVKKNEKREKGIHYNQWLSYADVLNRIRTTNCIVEVMEGGQQGVTLRTMEAICYNKKLLTNNQLMKKSKYYKTGHIQVFDCPADIDVAFVKDTSLVDYGYDGEFSPVHLLEHINQIEAENM